MAILITGETTDGHVVSVDGPDQTMIEKEVKKLEETNGKQEARIHNFETKAIQLTNLNFVVQGVILSTVTTKSPQCSRSWIPFVLSLFAAILNTVALCQTVFAFVKCSEELDKNLEDLRVVKEGKLTRAQAKHPVATSQKADPLKRLTRRAFSVFRIVLFVGFSLVTLYGCFSFMC